MRGLTDTKREFKESGQFSTSNNQTIASNEVYAFSLDDRYKPYDDVLLTNDSNNDVLITYNGRHSSFLPKGNSNKLDSENVSSVQIKNIGSTDINADEIRLFYKSTGIKGRKKVEKVAGAIGLISNLKILRGF